MFFNSRTQEEREMSSDGGDDGSFLRRRRREKSKKRRRRGARQACQRRRRRRRRGKRRGEEGGSKKKQSAQRAKRRGNCAADKGTWRWPWKHVRPSVRPSDRRALIGTYLLRLRLARLRLILPRFLSFSYLLRLSSCYPTYYNFGQRIWDKVSDTEIAVYWEPIGIFGILPSHHCEFIF